MNKLLILLLGTAVLGTAIADTTINLDQKQLSITRDYIKREGSAAISNMSTNQPIISNIKLKNLDMTETNTEIQAAQNEIKNVKPLSNKLPNGQKYYLYSESLVSDSKELLSQYKKPLIDINQTISDYNAMIKNSKATIGDNRMLIFISNSMPKKAIRNLMKQSSPIGAVFVIRGLINGSYVNTFKYLSQLKGDNTVGIMINPNLFKYFNVTTVPTFALYQSKEDLFKSACKASPVYTKVEGDVTVHFALEQLEKSNLADLAQIATNELNILNNSNFYGSHNQ